MSIVACRILEDGYEIAADSISVRGSTQTKNNINRSKLVEVNNMVIGAVGLAEESGLLQIFAKTHRPSAATEEGILEFWNEFSEWKKKRTDRGSIENSYFIGIDDDNKITDIGMRRPHGFVFATDDIRNFNSQTTQNRIFRVDDVPLTLDIRWFWGISLQLISP